MMEYTCIKLRKNDSILYANSNDIFLKPGTLCISETEHGIDIGTTLKIKKCVNCNEGHEIEGKVLRKANEEDLEEIPKIEEIENKAFDVCKTKANEKNLEMKLVNVKAVFDRTKIIFYFVAENRIDFRELVRDLAAIFRTRIEMRQIGVRDESRMVGGFGPCGLSLCCTKFQGSFAPVSIKMAKEQNLNLNSLKISGTCGRLLCCLDYEHEVYSELNSKLPQPGSKIMIKDKICNVIATETLKESVRVHYEDNFLHIKRSDLEYNGNVYRLKNEALEQMLHHDEPDEDEDQFGL